MFRHQLSTPRRRHWNHRVGILVGTHFLLNLVCRTHARTLLALLSRQSFPVRVEGLLVPPSLLQKHGSSRDTTLAFRNLPPQSESITVQSPLALFSCVGDSSTDSCTWGRHEVPARFGEPIRACTARTDSPRPRSALFPCSAFYPNLTSIASIFLQRYTPAMLTADCDRMPSFPRPPVATGYAIATAAVGRRTTWRSKRSSPLTESKSRQTSSGRS